MFTQIRFKLFQDLKNWLLRPPEKTLRIHLCHGRQIRMPHLEMQGPNNILQVCRLGVSISNERPTPRGRAVSSTGTNQLGHARLPGGPPKLHEHVPTRRKLTRHKTFSAKYPEANLTLGHINAFLEQGQRPTTNEQRSRTTNNVHPHLNPVVINENMNKHHMISQLGMVHGTRFLNQPPPTVSVHPMSRSPFKRHSVSKLCRPPRTTSKPELAM